MKSFGSFFSQKSFAPWASWHVSICINTTATDQCVKPLISLKKQQVAFNRPPDEMVPFNDPKRDQCVFSISKAKKSSTTCSPAPLLIKAMYLNAKVTISKDTLHFSLRFVLTMYCAQVLKIQRHVAYSYSAIQSLISRIMNVYSGKFWPWFSESEKPKA